MVGLTLNEQAEATATRPRMSLRSDASVSGVDRRFDLRRGRCASGRGRRSRRPEDVVVAAGSRSLAMAPPDFAGAEEEERDVGAMEDVLRG